MSKQADNFHCHCGTLLDYTEQEQGEHIFADFVCSKCGDTFTIMFNKDGKYRKIKSDGSLESCENEE